MKKILIVDDDADIKELMTFFLEKKGYAIISSDNGQEALKLLESQSPDLIIMDMLMPEMDGIQTIEELQKEPKTKNIPVIMVSGARDEMDMMKGFMGDHVSYIEKPFSHDKLLSLIDKIFLKDKEEE